MLASLPMYDRPEAMAANDRLWSSVRDQLRAAGQGAPEGLTRAADLWAQWRAPDLVLSQTCGLPYRARLHDRVTLVASPDLGLEGCAPGWYRSVLVARRRDPRTEPAQFAAAPLAYNEPLSQSGWAAIHAFAQAAGFGLNAAVRTGAHRASAMAVRDGAADWAAIDAQTWRMIGICDDWAAQLKVIGQTEPTPGLPFITAPGRDPAPLRAALAHSIAQMPAPDRTLLGLQGVVWIAPAAYLALPLPPEPQPAGS